MDPVMDEFDNPLNSGASFENLGGYLEAVSRASNETNDTRAGQFYSFTHKPSKKPTSNGNAFVDRYPLIYLYGPIGKDAVEGLNFHFLPVPVRMWWLDVVNRLSGGAIEKNEMVKLPAEMLQSLDPKLEFARRIYRLDGIVLWRRLDSSKMRELCSFNERTYVQASYNTVATAFRCFNPKLK